MTIQKSFKHRVRARMAKTGESYTAARRMLIGAGDHPEPESTSFTPPYADATVIKATGHDWKHWFSPLDEWNATTHSHGEIAHRLNSVHGVSGWWSQSIAVAYERARGMRAPGQQPDGWTIGASKTILAPVERLFEAFTDEAIRERWLPGAEMRLRTSTPPRLARYDWEDGSTRLVLGFETLDDGKSRVFLQHERLPDAETAEEMKTWWRERVTTLKTVLEEPDSE